MCMEDVKIGQKSHSDIRVIPVGIATLTSVVQADDKRIAVTFSGDGVTDIWIMPEGIDPANGQGFCLSAENPIRTFTVYELGRIVQTPWKAFGGAAVVNLVVSTMSYGGV